MIISESLSSDWISARRKKYSKDPAIMEAMIYAFYLLENLKITDLEFIFKGGTSLVLLLDQPKRFSVDIDIILKPSVTKEILESHLSKISTSSAFTGMELDKRRSYQEGEIIRVTMPSINSISADKLTAFAPNTTGVPYGTGKEKEIMKQLFDVGCLFDEISDIEVVKQSFESIVKSEIKYRPERKIESNDQVLQDIIDTSLTIAGITNLSRKETEPALREINTGINQFKHYLFEGTFGLLEAKVESSKVALLAAIIL